MSKVHVRKALDGKSIYFKDGWGKSNSRIPKYCIYCGSSDITEENLGSYDSDGIFCKNCGAHIHDCCTQQQ